MRMRPLAKSFGVPIAVHFNGYDLSQGLHDPRTSRNVLRNAKRYDACIVVARYMEEWLGVRGVPTDRIARIPYGIPFETYEQSSGVGNAMCEFLAVGRFTEKKRPDLTIRAFAKCHGNNPSTKLTMVGDGPHRERCEKLCSELGVERHVQFTGILHSERVQYHMEKASVFVQHSVTAANGDKEGWPVSIAEAAGCGLPVVATKHASIPEQVLDGESGLLVDEGNWAANGRGNGTTSWKYAPASPVGTAARKHISRWDTSNQVRKLESLLSSLADG